MALDRGRGIAVKYRIALAFVATSCMAGAAFAADLPVGGPYRPGAFMVRQPVEWTGLYFGANAGYGWGKYSSNITFAGGGASGLTNPITGITPQGIIVPVAGPAERACRVRAARAAPSPEAKYPLLREPLKPEHVKRRLLASRDVRLRGRDRWPVVGTGEYLFGRLRARLHRHRIHKDQIARDRARSLRFGF